MEHTTQIYGLTGGIGCGKSWVAECFTQLGVPVFDADACVHELLDRKGEAVESVKEVFPDVYDRSSRAINRQKLGAIVFTHDSKLKLLESIIHPLVQEKRNEFIEHHKHQSAPLIVLDIPLLFETGADGLCDKVIVVSVPKEIQLERVRARGTHTEAVIQTIMEQQGDLEEKRNKADIVIDNSGSKEDTKEQVQTIVKGVL